MRSFVKRLVEQALCQWQDYRNELSLLALSALMLMSNYWRDSNNYRVEDLWREIYLTHIFLPGVF